MTATEPGRKFALLVDDDAATASLVRQALAESQLDLVETKSLVEAFARMDRNLPRLVLSELALPDGSGFSICRHVRESGALADVPVMMLSEWSHESDRILAFECGADDFLPKPFFQRELASRIRAVLRRSEASNPENPSVETRRPSPLAIDEERRQVRFEGIDLPLTPREFELLATLARHEGRVLSRGDLIAEAWRPGERPTERSVDAHVKSLRRKLAAAKDSIETVRGRGYRYAERNLTRGRS
ncbi:MAG: response regulator transcription factor [Myxococcota bacterium]